MDFSKKIIIYILLIVKIEKFLILDKLKPKNKKLRKLQKYLLDFNFNY